MAPLPSSPTPADLHIESRNLQFRQADQAVRWWHGGDPIATAFHNALSALFPQGERFFIDSVKRYRGVGNSRLQEQIATFITQEALHTREHVVFNRIATERGYDLSRIDDLLARRLAWARSQRPVEQLAATIALEHFTAILAHELLNDPRYLDGVPPAIQNLWRWHAVEEIEHKAVAFDTFVAATASMPRLARWHLRSVVMVIATSIFVQEVVFGISEFFRQDGINGARSWFKMLRYLFISPGILRRVLGSYFKYYLPGFHPWHVDDRALIGRYELSIA